MNHPWPNLNSLAENTFQGSAFPRHATSNAPNRLPPEIHTLKGKAYINPHIVNCEYIKRTLPPANKIHVNPNFKGNGFSDLQNRTTHLPVRTESKVIHLNSNFSQESGSSVVGDENPQRTSFDVVKNDSGKTSTFKPSSKFKKINNHSLKTSTEFNKSSYSWSKEKHKDVSNKINPISGLKHVAITAKAPKIHDVKNFIMPASSYKYTAPKESSKIVNSLSKNCLSSKKSTPIYLSKTKIINKSETKLINNLSPKSKVNFKAAKTLSPARRNIFLSKYVYSKSKKSPVMKVASLVRNKYKYCKGAGCLKSSKYKLDKRKKVLESSKKKQSLTKVNDIRKLFPQSVQSRVKMSIQNTYSGSQMYNSSIPKNVHSWSRDQTEIMQRKTNHFPNRRVINIGGILYKSTVNKLTLAKDDKKNQSELKSVISIKSKGKKNHVVYVRGEKFILDKNGKTLRRQSGSIVKNKVTSKGVKRIDIGGVTYLQKSVNVLIRTNVHQARNVVKQAKHKSIAMLSTLHKKSTKPCMIYHKFGKCNRHIKGLCMYKHDQKNIALCKKFLKGECNDSKCLLSHEVIQEKMATCHFFLNGFCSRENCPFLHVKLNKKAAICENFLQGFCTLGKDCSKKHLYQCPEFDKHGKCSLGTKCHYPHKTSDNGQEVTENTDVSSCQIEEGTERLKYYVKTLNSIPKQRKMASKKSITETKFSPIKREKKSKKKKKKSTQTSSNCSQVIDTIECFPKRVKLDELPCFIPLKADQ